MPYKKRLVLGVPFQCILVLQNGSTIVPFEMTCVKCPICMRDLDPDAYFLLECHHKIHIDCVASWETHYSQECGASCPRCQQKISWFLCKKWYVKCAQCKGKNYSESILCNDCYSGLLKVTNYFKTFHEESLLLFPLESNFQYQDVISEASNSPLTLELYIESLKRYALELAHLNDYFDQIDTIHFKNTHDVLQMIRFLLYYRDKKYRLDFDAQFLEDRWECYYLLQQTKHKSYRHCVEYKPILFIMDEYIRVLLRFQASLESNSDEHLKELKELKLLMKSYESCLFSNALVSFLKNIDKEIINQKFKFVKYITPDDHFNLVNLHRKISHIDDLYGNQNLPCPICKLNLDKDCYILQCKHKIHIDCVEGWKQQYSSTCPRCNDMVSLFHCHNYYSNCNLCHETNFSRLTMCFKCRLQFDRIQDLFKFLNGQVSKHEVVKIQSEMKDISVTLSDENVFKEQLKVYALEISNLTKYLDQINLSNLKSIDDILDTIKLLFYVRDQKFKRDMYPDYLENRCELVYLVEKTKNHSYSLSNSWEPILFVMDQYVQSLFAFKSFLQFTSERDDHIRAFDTLRHLMREFENYYFRKALISFIETIDKRILQQIDGLVELYEENRVLNEIPYSELLKQFSCMKKLSKYTKYNRPNMPSCYDMNTDTFTLF